MLVSMKTPISIPPFLEQKYHKGGFHMADVITDSTTLKVDNLFVDGDTRVITLKNPKQNISTSEITALQNFMQANNVIVGDRYSGTFGRIESVTRVTERRTSIDLS